MNTSPNRSAAPAERLLDTLRSAARRRFSSDAQWARASGVPRETLSRLRKRGTCDSRTLWALAAGAGCALIAVPLPAGEGAAVPERFDRDYESSLLDLCASGDTDAAAWRAYGSGFFMGGLATLFAGADGFDRQRYLRLAESLHAGITTPEVFGMWLEQSPVRPARFLPMLRARLAHRPRP